MCAFVFIELLLVFPFGENLVVSTSLTFTRLFGENDTFSSTRKTSRKSNTSYYAHPWPGPEAIDLKI